MITDNCGMVRGTLYENCSNLIISDIQALPPGDLHRQNFAAIRSL